MDSKKFIAMFIGMSVRILVCYLFGTIWFMFFYSKTVGSINLYKALSMCVFPFIIPDLCKILIAIPFSKRMSRYVKL